MATKKQRSLLERAMDFVQTVNPFDNVTDALEGNPQLPSSKPSAETLAEQREDMDRYIAGRDAEESAARIAKRTDSQGRTGFGAGSSPAPSGGGSRSTRGTRNRPNYDPGNGSRTATKRTAKKVPSRNERSRGVGRAETRRATDRKIEKKQKAISKATRGKDNRAIRPRPQAGSPQATGTYRRAPKKKTAVKKRQTGR